MRSSRSRPFHDSERCRPETMTQGTRRAPGIVRGMDLCSVKGWACLFLKSASTLCTEESLERCSFRSHSECRSVDWPFAPSSSFSFPEAWVLRREWQPSKCNPRDRQPFHSGRPKTYPLPVPWARPRVLPPLQPPCLRSPSAGTNSPARRRWFSHCGNPSAELRAPKIGRASCRERV